MRAVLQGTIDAGADTANRCLPMNYEVLIVYDHPLFRAALRSAVAAAALKMNLSGRGFVRINHPPTLRAFLPE